MAHPLARSLDREIWRLALPAFLALVAEPLFLLADAAIVGHLGTAALAGLGIAAVVLQTLVGLCVFLAYGTTASVARLLGAGDRRAALAQGIDGVWLAIGLGFLITLVGVMTTGPLVRLLGAGPEVAEPATTYLRIAFLGVTPLLVMLATTGILRGLQDTRTPLVVAVAGNALNIVLNLLLVYGISVGGTGVDGLGIAGSALGSVLAQLASAAALLAVVVRGARRESASLRPDLPGIRRAAHASVALVIRTLTLRAALLLTTYAVVLGADASSGDDQSVSIATHQLSFTIWSFLAFGLDAIAIAAQAITGRYLGAGDRPGTRAVTGRMVRWGAVSGVATGPARRRGRAADRRRRVRPRRRPDRRRRRHVPRVGRPRRPRGVRAGGAARRRSRRRGGRGLGDPLGAADGGTVRGAHGARPGRRLDGDG